MVLAGGAGDIGGEREREKEKTSSSSSSSSKMLYFISTYRDPKKKKQSSSILLFSTASTRPSSRGSPPPSPSSRPCARRATWRARSCDRRHRRRRPKPGPGQRRRRRLPLRGGGRRARSCARCWGQQQQQQRLPRGPSRRRGPGGSEKEKGRKEEVGVECFFSGSPREVDITDVVDSLENDAEPTALRRTESPSLAIHRTWRGARRVERAACIVGKCVFEAVWWAWKRGRESER